MNPSPSYNTCNVIIITIFYQNKCKIATLIMLQVLFITWKKTITLGGIGPRKARIFLRILNKKRENHRNHDWNHHQQQNHSTTITTSINATGSKAYNYFKIQGQMLTSKARLTIMLGSIDGLDHNSISFTHQFIENIALALGIANFCFLPISQSNFFAVSLSSRLCIAGTSLDRP